MLAACGLGWSEAVDPLEDVKAQIHSPSNPLKGGSGHGGHDDEGRGRARGGPSWVVFHDVDYNKVPVQPRRALLSLANIDYVVAAALVCQIWGRMTAVSCANV